MDRDGELGEIHGCFPRFRPEMDRGEGEQYVGD